MESSSFFSWKQSLYAFLFRRLLGPYLSDDSLKQLHASLDVSLTDGRIELYDIELNPSFCNKRIAATTRVAVIRAKIEHLRIELSLQENPNDQPSKTKGSSVAWKALNLGSGGISLLVHVEIDGIQVLLGPANSSSFQQPPPAAPEKTNHDTINTTTPSSSFSYSTMISSCLDAALASMRLSMLIKNIRVRLMTTTREGQVIKPPSNNGSIYRARVDPDDCFLQLTLEHLKYHDASSSVSGVVHYSTPSTTTTMHKALDFAGITIGHGVCHQEDGADHSWWFGESDSSATITTIMKINGNGVVSLRVVSSEIMGGEEMQSVKHILPRIKQDLEVRLHSQIQISLDRESLYQLSMLPLVVGQQQQPSMGYEQTAEALVNQDGPLPSFWPSFMVNDNPPDDTEQDTTEGQDDRGEPDEDAKTLQGIMYQYMEARQLVERQAVRGGILVPSDDNDKNGTGRGAGSSTRTSTAAPMVSFDAFFDANDASFSKYVKSVVEDSMLQDENSDEEDEDAVHTQIKLHLGDCGVKVSFPYNNLAHSVPPEYVLCSLGDINAVARLTSRGLVDMNASMGHWDIEASCLQPTAGDAGRPEIVTILRFETDDDMMNENIVALAPCIDLQLSSSRVKEKKSERKETSLDLRLQPMRVYGHPKTLRNITKLLDSLPQINSSDNNKVVPTMEPDHATTEPKSDQKSLISLSVWCPSVDILVPFEDRKEYVGMYQRCGYLVPNETLSGNAFFGVTLDDVVVSYQEATELESDDRHKSSKFSCQHTVVFVMSPVHNNFKQITGMKRLDIMAFSGVDPLSVERKRVSPANQSSSQQLSSSIIMESSSETIPAPSTTNKDEIFPRVPVISSFKARQEDFDFEDEFSEQIVDALRPHDPQLEMIRLAQMCEEMVQIHIPDVSLDLTRKELFTVAQMFTCCGAEFSGMAATRKKTKKTPVRTCSEELSRFKAIRFCMDQITICLHEDDNDNAASFKIIGSGWEGSAVMMDNHSNQGSKPVCLRVLAHGFDLYFAQHLKTKVSSTVAAPSTVVERCDFIRHRVVRNPKTRATPVLYRSQLFNQLSSNSPAIRLDALNRSMDHHYEWNTYFTVYNMTHRFDVDSDWIERLINLVKQTNESNKEHDRQQQQDEATKFVKLFVAVADCNVDYTSSPRFKRASRTIARVSDIRLSSNLVSPPGPLQTFRVSVGDLAVLHANRHHPYNAENAQLARAATILPPEALDVVHRTKHRAPDIGQMDLVTMLTLDSLVSQVTLAAKMATTEPATTACVTCGQLSLYGCKDSFSCFVDTMGELTMKLTALSETAIREAKELEQNSKPPVGKEHETNAQDDEGDDLFFDTQSGDDGLTESGIHTTNIFLNQDPEKWAIDLPQGPTIPITPPSPPEPSSDRFDLDGYDWTTVDNEWSRDDFPAGEEQVARWYSSPSPHEVNPPAHQTGSITSSARTRSGGDDPSTLLSSSRIRPHHIQLKPTVDPLNCGDMEAASRAGTEETPSVRTRVLMRDLKIRCRFFDGYDWPHTFRRDTSRRGSENYAFLIDEPLLPDGPAKSKSNKEGDRKAKLMGDLLKNDHSDEGMSTFEAIPLPEEKGSRLQRLAEQRRLSRRINQYLQVSVSGLKCRMDAFAESSEHHLASCLELVLDDLFVSESISGVQPVKLMGEWFNENEHPRDSSVGLLTMKIVTWHPEQRITDEHEIANDLSEGVLQLLPLRCNIDQRAIRFAKKFFGSDKEDGQEEASSWDEGLKAPPPPLFTLFTIKPCKLKVDYAPEKIDVDALRDGSTVELINLSPLNSMVIVLKTVQLQSKVGFGEVLLGMAKGWIQDICATQMYKFVTNASPFQPITSIGRGAADMVILPWEALKEQRGGDNKKVLAKALQKGITSFAGSVAYETLNVTAKLTGMAAQSLSGQSRGSGGVPSSMAMVGGGGGTTPIRPARPPRNVWDTTNHALESMARSLEVANYKIVVVPYREYQRSGAASAATSIVKGIPIAIMAPVGAASEAMSFALLGARNQLRPDIRQEEEASLRGLYQEDITRGDSNGGNTAGGF